MKKIEVVQNLKERTMKWEQSKRRIKLKKEDREEEREELKEKKNKMDCLSSPLPCHQ